MIKIAAEPLLQYSPCSLDPWCCHIQARYHESPHKVPNYTAWWTEAHWCEQLAQGCCPTMQRPGIEPTICPSRVQHPNHYTTEPCVHVLAVKAVCCIQYMCNFVHALYITIHCGYHTHLCALLKLWIMIFVYRRVSSESADSPVTAVTDLSINENTFIIATQWNKHVRMWTVSGQGFLTPCNSVAGWAVLRLCSEEFYMSHVT